MKMKKNYLFVLCGIILTAVFTPLSGRFYEGIIGRKLSSGFWGPSHPEYIPGFIIAFAFFCPFIVNLNLKEKNYKATALSVLIPILIALLLRIGELFVLTILATVIGYLLAQGILLVKNRMARK